MKWFKHFSTASDDEFIAKLEGEFGIEGYARWWKILESISKQMDESDRCHAEYPIDKWKQLLCIKQEKFLKLFLNFCQTSGKLSVELSEKIIKVSCPKLLELRDEHTRKLRSKSGLAPDKVAQEAEADKEVDKKDAAAIAHAKDFDVRLQKIINSPVPMQIGQRIRLWKLQGATESLIEETITEIMRRRCNSPPNSILYFDKAISSAVAALSEPLSHTTNNGATYGKQQYPTKQDRLKRAAIEAAIELGIEPNR